MPKITWWTSIGLVGLMCLISVSYTHLDVYKRQYICSINEDALLSIQPLMSEEYAKIVQDNIILELNDDSPLSLIHI